METGISRQSQPEEDGVVPMLGWNPFAAFFWPRAISKLPAGATGALQGKG